MISFTELLPRLVVKKPKRPCPWCHQINEAKGRAIWHKDCLPEFFFETRQAYRAAKVYERDKGVCALCRLDTDLTARWLNALQADAYWSAFSKHDDTLFKYAIRYLVTVGFYRWPRSLWEADHIVPTVEGGTNTMQNLRTLCVPCHKRETALLRTRLARARSPQTRLSE